MTVGSFAALDTTLCTAAGDRHSRDEMVLGYGGGAGYCVSICCPSDCCRAVGKQFHFSSHNSHNSSPARGMEHRMPTGPNLHRGGTLAQSNRVFPSFTPNHEGSLDI